MELGNAIFGNSRGEYKVNRDWQEDFYKFLVAVGFDGYGDIEEEYLDRQESQLWKYSKIDKSEMGDSTYFENDTFIIRPYYWGDDDDIVTYPNFVYKPTNFQLSWYKYPLRDSYMNQDITKQELDSIMMSCAKSICEDGNYKWNIK